MLRSVDDVAVENHARSGSRKPTIIYPIETVSTDTLDSKPKPTGRRSSSSPVIPDAPGTEDLMSPLKKKASMARMNSKLPDSSKEHGNSVPHGSSKGMLLQSAASNRNLLQPAPSSKNLVPGILTAQPSRITRTNSVMSRTVCSNTHPWLLKIANTAGTTMGDYELGRVIGKSIFWFASPSLLNYSLFYVQGAD